MLTTSHPELSPADRAHLLGNVDWLLNDALHMLKELEAGGYLRDGKKIPFWRGSADIVKRCLEDRVLALKRIGVEPIIEVSPVEVSYR
jgi:hypothetical protein